MPRSTKITPTISSRPRIHVSDVVGLARANGGYFSGGVRLRDVEVLAQLDVDIDLDLLRLAQMVDGSVHFIETRLAAEPMPRGGLRRKGICTTCGRRSLVLYVSEDSKQLCCSACARVRYVSRCLSNDRRAWFEATKVLARRDSEATAIDARAHLLVPARQRARFERNVRRVASKHATRVRRLAAIAGVTTAEVGDLDAFLGLVHRTLDARISREVLSGKHDAGIRLLLAQAAKAVRSRSLLLAPARVAYWAAFVRQLTLATRPRLVLPGARSPGTGSPPSTAGGPSLPSRTVGLHPDTVSEEPSHPDTFASASSVR